MSEQAVVYRIAHEKGLVELVVPVVASLTNADTDYYSWTVTIGPNHLGTITKAIETVEDLEIEIAKMFTDFFFWWKHNEEVIENFNEMIPDIMPEIGTIIQFLEGNYTYTPTA